MCINDKSGTFGLIYRPDSSCSLLSKSITSPCPSSLSSSPRNIFSYFDYLDKNSPQDYTVKENIKLLEKINRYSSISLPRSERELLASSSGTNFVFDHNSLNNHERCIVCYHEFYVSKRLR
ncbi:unnamed protein product [Schistosoma turkestanicum]|nr:unnamed protein product [Schistosoma turkestanicum]